MPTLSPEVAPHAPRLGDAPVPKSGRARRGLVLVSAGLGLDGGGRAAAGRLLAGAVADFARREGLGLEVLTLGEDGAPGLTVPTRRFGRRHAALAGRAWAGQLLAGSPRPAHVFDLLGVARPQAWLPAGWRAPYLVMLYGIEVWRPLSGDRARALAGATARLAISRHTLERARRFHPGLEAAVLPLALEERSPAGEVDRELLARAGEGFLLIVGRMAAGERYKGHDEVLEAMPRLASEARLIVAGDGDDRPRLEAKAAALGLAGSVLFTGFVSEATLAELYRRSAALVLPSRGEGFGLVYLEAMRAGKPCLATRGSAAEEVVEDGVTALLVDPEDGEELAAALSRLLGEPGLAGKLGEAGRRRWLRDFSAERFRERLRPHLERLTAVYPL